MSDPVLKAPDGSPVWNFTEPQCFTVIIKQKKNNKIVNVPVQIKMSPYTPAELKAILKKSVSGYKRDKGNLEIVREDRGVYTPLFDEHFVEVLNSTSNSPVEQRKFFEAKPELKSQVVEATFGAIAVEPPADVENGEVLDIFSTSDSSIVIFQNLYNEAAKDNVKVTMEHTYAQPSEGQFRAFRKARKSTVLQRNAMVSVSEDHSAFEKLYDDLIVEVSGGAVSGKPCVQATKAEWVAEIPLWHKLLVVDQIFADVLEKND